ncbi:tyrosine recombinase XerC [Chitinimonas sp. BJB300]|nr:tyrosine recombinase XerC [Chitinimonas sp. BJB300]PHV12365.1 tyrosine recombinase XerC [Chitinimonas sp. BJB300]TSJ91651.1 tyrosine recombinase XerC [Chitinimonas sp. BJB300]
MTPLARFERYLTGEHGSSAATRSAYLADAQLLLDLAGDCPLDRLTARDIRGFVRQMRQRKHDARSIARRLSAWRTWFRLLVRETDFTLNPVASVRAPRAEKKLPRPVSVDAAAGFLDNLSDNDPLALRDRAMYELAYSSGLRVSELVGADLADLHPDATLRVLGKGGKSRVVPVGRIALAAIANWLPCRTVLLQAGETALFLNRFGHRMTARAVQMRLSNWSDKLGLGDKLHPHRLRHACASHFLQASGDLRATQELLGHASIATTQIYTHLDFNRLSEVYDQSHPRAKVK